MAENKNSNVIPQTEEAKNKARQEDLARTAKYVGDTISARQARFDNPVSPISDAEVRSQRAKLVDSLTPQAMVDEGVNGNPQKPVDNPIPVKHNGEEPGEPDIGEDPLLVKVRPDVRDFVPQPEGHRVPKEAQLNGETGDGGVMPVESWERQGRVPADGETELPPPVSSNTIDENGDNEVGRIVRNHVENIEGQEVPDKSHENDPAPPQDTNVIDASGTNSTGAMLDELANAKRSKTSAKDKDEPENPEIGHDGPTADEPSVIDAQVNTDPEGKEKGLKTLADGTVIDAEGDKHLDQPDGHNDLGQTKTTESEGESDKDRLERLRDEYKAKFKKPANTRWSGDHLQALIDEKV